MEAQLIFEVDNLKCGGCENSVINALTKIDGLQSVDVSAENGRVEVVVSEDSPLLKDRILKTLSNLGYPPTGTTNALQKAKSYISCAIGRVS